MRKCFMCGEVYDHGESACEDCDVALTWLDGYRSWRSIRRSWYRRARFLSGSRPMILGLALVTVVLMAVWLGLVSSTVTLPTRLR